ARGAGFVWERVVEVMGSSGKWWSGAGIVGKGVTCLAGEFGVNNMWSVAPGNNSNPLCSMAMKLKFLKLKIKEWNQRNVKDLKSGKVKLKEDLEALDADIDKGSGTADMVTKSLEVVNSLQEINKLQTMEISQKDKIKWCIEGDENTSFFHGMLNKRRSQLSIHYIMVDEVWIEDPLKVKREFYQHFSIIFAKLEDQRAHINMEYPNTITLEQQIDLECDVTKEELKKAVWDCGIDKSPGPDGFTFSFYHRFWSTIENDVFEAVKYFFNSGVIPNGCNSSFLTLIPKVPDVNLVKDFRPISLIGSMYKIIAKILANRLVGVLGDIVNEVQSAFIAKRQILEGPFILNEVLQWFLVINGATGFKAVLDRREVLLSLMVVPRMSSISKKRVVDAGMFKGVQLNPSLNLSHMFYADDAVFVRQWCDDIINILTHVLDCFYWASGLRIDMSKSKIMGTKVGGSMSQIHVWDEVIDKNNNWIGGNTLKNLYPRIYALENFKHVTVCAMLADIALDASFRRKLRGGIECIQFNEMLVLMQDVSLTSISDRWTWSLEGSRDFSVASTRKAIDNKRLPVVNSKSCWIKYVPIKVNVHAWKVKLDTLPTRFNISRRRTVLDSILCPICNTGVESSSHLFFTCNLARQLSCKISQWWVTPFAEVNSYDEWRSWLVSLRLSSKHKLILKGVFYVMWWHIWSYRNKLLFDSKIPLKAMIFDEIVSRDIAKNNQRLNNVQMVGSTGGSLSATLTFSSAAAVVASLPFCVQSFTWAD
nr:RNA-directed DNA polymerase, eukaryota [Tanacetum cinerariifolium]